MSFTPPAGFESSFAAWEKGIGAAAYKSWLRGAKSWISLDGAINIATPSQVSAHWIRRNYAELLERIVANSVTISSVEDDPVSNKWPYGAPEGGMVNAWWKANERWLGDEVT